MTAKEAAILIRDVIAENPDDGPKQIVRSLTWAIEGGAFDEDAKIGDMNTIQDMIAIRAIVRCKDCAYYDGEEYRCTLDNQTWGTLDYCSYGQKGE